MESHPEIQVIFEQKNFQIKFLASGFEIESAGKEQNEIDSSLENGSVQNKIEELATLEENQERQVENNFDIEKFGIEGRIENGHEENGAIPGEQRAQSKPDQDHSESAESEDLQEDLNFYDASFYDFLIELKFLLNVDSDCLFTFPELELYSIHQDHYILKKLSVADFYSLLRALSIEKTWEIIPTLTVSIVKLPNCLVNRFSHLISLTKEGGLPTNPILIDDTSDNAISECLGDENEQVDGAFDANDQQEYPEIYDEIQANDVDDDVELINDGDFEVEQHKTVYSDSIKIQENEANVVENENQSSERDATDTPFSLANGNSEAVAQDDAIALQSVEEDDDLFSEEEEEEAKSLSDIVAASLATKNSPPSTEPANLIENLNDDFIEIVEEDYLTSSNSNLAPLFQKLASEGELVQNQNDILKDSTVSANELMENLEPKFLESMKREFPRDLQEVSIGTPKKIRI